MAVGNAVFAGIALLAGGADLVFGWRGFWLPLAGGVVWTAGNYCVFKASETIGLARALVARVGTGTGFTIAQLSLLVNASAGVWVFHVPEPGTRQARKVLAGIVLAGIGGCVIAALR